MPLLAPPLRSLPRLIAVVAVIAFSRTARAQINLSHTDDAAPIPKGMVRLNVTTGWSRFDERFTSTGKRTLGDELSTDSLGPRQFPALAPVETGLQTLANDPRLRLSLGSLAAVSGVRTVTTPIAIEYGLTKRLSVGILVPLVQTRRANSIIVNKDSTGNVSFVPNRSRLDAATANQAVYAAFLRAADSLGTLISRCPGNPSAAGCAAVNANPSDASNARTQALGFANAVKTALGTDTSTTLVAPVGGRALATSIDAQRTAINARLQAYLGAGAGASSGVFTASAPFTYIDLQGTSKAAGLLGSTVGGGLDSIHTINTLRLTAPSFGVQYLLFDRFRYDTLPPTQLQTRMMIGGSFRFATPIFDSAHTTLVVSTNDGPAAEVHSIMDVISGRFAATAAARFTHPFSGSVYAPLDGDPEAAYPTSSFGMLTRTVGSTLALDLTPRLLLGDWFAIDGHYGLEHTAATTYDFPSLATGCPTCNSALAFVPASHTAQRLGFGFRYSTVESTARGKTGFPIEVSFAHLQTISGDPGVANVSRDQIQVRLFLRVQD